MVDDKPVGLEDIFGDPGAGCSVKDFFCGAGVFMENEKWNWSAVNDETKIYQQAIIVNHPKLNITAKYSVLNPVNNFEFIFRIFNQSGTYQNKFSNRTSAFNQIL